MPRFPITITSVRADQLHRLAFAEYRSVQQQAAYMLEHAIAQAILDLHENDEYAADKPEPSHVAG